VFRSNLSETMAELGLFQIDDLGEVSLGAAVLPHHPADEALRRPVMLLRTATALSHREVRFAAQRRPGLRSFPSHRKVRLTAQQDP
jgi:hypothetical protein